MKQNKIPRNEYIRKPVGKTNPYKGDTIYTDMGQWEYPGQVTKIPSGDITMQGVPYPVYGEDNLGNSQMMYPGMDYQFPGQYVTEYPMAAYGGDPSLPNIEGHYPFGGQNTKTHTHMKEGGWLDNLTKAQEGIENIPYMGMRVPYKQEGFQKEQKFKKNPFDETLLMRQQFKESTFRPNVVSRAGARGLAQIKPDVQSDAIKAGVIKESDDIFDPKVNKKVQEWYMNNLYDSSFINKDGSDDQDSVKMAKSLAAYNWGRGNLLKYLNKEKEKGTDIYKSYDWLKNLPKETHDYVNKILLKKDPKFEAEFTKMAEDYPYKRGGQKRKRGTSKNIQSSMNDVFRRNYDVFGPASKQRFNPRARYKEGGWLDKYNNF